MTSNKAYRGGGNGGSSSNNNNNNNNTVKNTSTNTTNKGKIITIFLQKMMIEKQGIEK